MNNIFDDYKQQPDPEVWQRLEKDLRRRRIVRSALLGVVGLMVVAAVVYVVLPKQETIVSPEMTQLSSASLDDGQSILVSEEVKQDASPATRDAIGPQDHPQTEMVSNKMSSMQSEIAIADDQQMKDADSENQRTANAAPRMVAQPAIGTSTACPSVASNPPVASSDNCASKASKSPTMAHNASQPSKLPQHDTSVFELLMPNAFAPDDASADVRLFRAQAMAGATINNFRMMIYNRAGNLVFSTTDINQGWNGTYKGVAQSQGVFVYIVEYKNGQGKLQRRKGTALLIR